jgi:hypothetical protein
VHARPRLYPAIPADIDGVEMGTLTPRIRQAHAYEHAQPKQWWRVLCSVKMVMALGIVVLFWVLVVLAAVGRIKSVR